MSSPNSHHTFGFNDFLRESGKYSFEVDLISPRYDLRPGKSTRRLSAAQRQSRDEVISAILSGEWRFEVVPCPCGGEAFRTVSLQDRFGIPSPISACRACGLLQSNPRLTQEAYAEYYGKYYRRIYTLGWSPERLYQDQQSRGRWIRQWTESQGLRLASGDLVLEVGCGSGGILRAFAEAGCSVAGCDFDPAYLDWGRQQGLALSMGDSTQLLTFEGKARLVIVNHVLEHMLDPVAELCRIRRLLRPDGHVFIEVPGVEYEIGEYRWNGHLAHDFQDYAQNAHTYHFDLPDLLRLFQYAGYESAAHNNRITALIRPLDRFSGPRSTGSTRGDADDKGAEQLTRLRNIEARRRSMICLYAPLQHVQSAGFSAAALVLRSLGLLSLAKSIRTRLLRAQ